MHPSFLPPTPQHSMLHNKAALKACHLRRKGLQRFPAPPEHALTKPRFPQGTTHLTKTSSAPFRLHVFLSPPSPLGDASFLLSPALLPEGSSAAAPALPARWQRCKMAAAAAQGALPRTAGPRLLAAYLWCDGVSTTPRCMLGEPLQSEGRALKGVFELQSAPCVVCSGASACPAAQLRAVDGQMAAAARCGAAGAAPREHSSSFCASCSETSRLCGAWKLRSAPFIPPFAKCRLAERPPATNSNRWDKVERSFFFVRSLKNLCRCCRGHCWPLQCLHPAVGAGLIEALMMEQGFQRPISASVQSCSTDEE